MQSEDEDFAYQGKVIKVQLKKCHCLLNTVPELFYDGLDWMPIVAKFHHITMAYSKRRQKNVS